jgi:hypothetical protein
MRRTLWGGPAGGCGGRGRLRPGAFRVLGAALVLSAACARGDSGAAPTPGPCASRRPPIGPDVATSLRAEDSGVTLCLKVGEKISVYLNAPLGQDPWQRLDSSRGKVLARGALNQVTLARGVTASLYTAAKPGVTELSSVRSPCADPHGGCDAAHAWTAVVVVSR